VELLAALSITGVAIGGAVTLLAQLGDASDRIAKESSRVAREGNGARLLTRLLMDAHASTDSTKRFRGDENSVELWTLCDVPGGWSEECRATLAIDHRGDSSVVLATMPGGGALSVRRQKGIVAFRYYNPSAPDDTAWARQWSSNASLPVAVGLVTGTDTTVLPVGPIRD
jgi:hypothetical protein